MKIIRWCGSGHLTLWYVVSNSLEDTLLHLHSLSETGGNIFCHNFATQLPNYMVSQTRKPHTNAVMNGNGHKLWGWDLVRHSTFPCH